MKATARRLARLEAQAEARHPATWPSYLCGVDEDDLQAQLQALRAQGFTGRVHGYISVCPDDWEHDA